MSYSQDLWSLEKRILSHKILFFENVSHLVTRISDTEYKNDRYVRDSRRVITTFFIIHHEFVALWFLPGKQQYRHAVARNANFSKH